MYSKFHPVFDASLDAMVLAVATAAKDLKRQIASIAPPDMKRHLTHRKTKILKASGLFCDSIGHLGTAGDYLLQMIMTIMISRLCGYRRVCQFSLQQSRILHQFNRKLLLSQMR